MNACLSVWGVTALPIPARRATLQTIRPAPCRSIRRPSEARNTGPSVRSAMARSIARGARRQRDGDHFAALAGDGQGPVPALQAQVLDVRAGGFGHPQAVQGEQGDQRMLERRTQSSRDEKGTELVTVQGNGGRLAVDPWTADVRG
jgi:hypothetical protein